MANMRTVGVRLRMFVGDHKRDTHEAAGDVDKMAGRIEAAGKKSRASLDRIATGAGIAGAALTAMAALTVRAAMQFDKQMSEVGAVAGATADEMDRLRQAAIDAGAATVFSAGQAAQAEAELAKAGITTADILSGGLTGALDLASAGSLDLATSAEIAANAMNTFGLSGTDVSHIADVLASAANKSAAGVDDLGQGLQQVGLVANQVGLSLEETVGLLAAFADRGLKGSDGATSLKTALQRLAAPVDSARQKMDQLGLSMYDSNGNMVGAVEIAGQLQGALSDLAPEQRNAALQTIFGSDAIRAANILYAEGADGIQDYIDAVNDQGAAARMAGTKLDNLAGDVEQLTGSLETLFIQSGSGASGGLRLLTQAATGVTNSIAGLPAPVQTATVAVAGLTGAGLLTAAAAIKVKTKIAETVEALEAMGPAGARAARGLELTTKWGGRALGTLAALQIAGGLAGTVIDSDLNPQIDAAAAGLAQWDRQSDLAGESARLFGKDALGLAASMQVLAQGGFYDVINQVDNFAANLLTLNGPIDDARTSVAAFDAALTHLVQKGQADKAAQLVATMAEKTGISIEQARALLPSYTGAIEVATRATADQAAAADESADANARLRSTFGELALEVDGLTGDLQGLNSQLLGWRDAERDAEAAVDDLQEALAASNGSLDIHGEQGRRAAEAVDRLAAAAFNAAQKKLDETHSVDDANRVYQTYVEQLRKILMESGKTKAEVDKLVAAIASMPTSKTVTINVRTATSETHSETYRATRRWGGITEHALAGLLKERRAQTGVLNQAAIYSPPTRYAFAEPATGGEAFVPRHGDRSRSMGILSAAAGWYGADVVPRGGWYGSGMGGAMSEPMEIVVTPAPGSDARVMNAIVNGLRFEVRTKARGDVANLVNSRRGQ